MFQINKCQHKRSLLLTMSIQQRFIQHKTTVYLLFKLLLGLQTTQIGICGMKIVCVLTRIEVSCLDLINVIIMAHLIITAKNTSDD